MTLISPSILSADFAQLKIDINKVEQAGADWLHIDVMDGHFVPNITIGVPVVQSIRKVTDLPLDVHLMIENPEKYIQAFSHAGADILTFHYEAVKEESIKSLIKEIKKLDIKAGMSIKPKTHVDVLYPYIDDLDLVLVMTVEPGFGGQQFMRDCADKLPKLKKRSHEGLIIQVDGGINEQTGKVCTQLGANCLVAGNYIYKSDDILKAIKSLKN